MSNERKVVRGGFRATLALIVSIIALILAIMAFNRTGGEADLRDQIGKLQARMEEMKKETSERMKTVREETAAALEKISKTLRKEESGQ